MNNRVEPNELDVHALLRTFSWLRFGFAFTAVLLLSLSRSLFSAETIANWIRLATLAIWVIYFSVPQIQHWLKKAYLPIGLVGMTASSLLSEIMTQWMLIDANQTPLAFGSQSRIYLTLFVVILCAAWLYRFRVALALSVSAMLMNMLLYWFFLEVTPSMSPVDFSQLLQISVMSAIIFGLIGYVVSGLSRSVQNRRIELAAANQKLAHYAGRLEELTISRERNRMARELHDTLAHTLSGLTVQLEATQLYLDVDEATAKRLLNQSLEATRFGLQETRRALQSLRASPLEDLGLVLALRGLAESAESRAHLKLKLDLPTQPIELPAAIEQGIYRIAQEAVYNVVKHATAQTLTLSLTINGKIKLMVADDGVGFSVPDKPSAEFENAATKDAEGGHYGLVGIRERAALINGQVTITSQLGQGTTILLTVDRE